MALMKPDQHPRESGTAIAARFGIAQDGRPSEEQLTTQADIRQSIASLAVYANQNIADGRAKSLGMTALEEALMWLGKAIFAPEEEQR